MSSNKLLTNIILLVLAMVLIYFGYRWLGKPGATPETGLTAEGFAEGRAGANVSDEFLTTLTGLQELNLGGEVFTDPVFKDLQDNSTELRAQTPGRSNPFVPINFEATRSVAPKTATSSSGTSTPAR